MSDARIILAKSIQLEIIESQADRSGKMMLEARRRLPLNLLSNLGWLLLNMLVGLWYTPYIISHLGVAVYGLVPLATSVTHYLALLTDGFDGAVSRFLVIDLVRGEAHSANRTFNTAITGALTIFAILLPIAFLISWLTPHVFHVPVGFERDAQYLVLLTSLAFAVTFLSSSFAVTSFAFHRFDLRLCVNLVRLSVQMGSVVLLFAVLSPHLWEVGLGIFLSSLFLLFGHSLISRKLTPQFRIKLGLFDLERLKRMLQFSGWMLVNQAGIQLFLNIDLAVANLIFGAHVGGRYGAIMIFPVTMRVLVATIGGVIEPIVFTLYSENNPIGLARFCRLAVKFMGLAIALPIGLICGMAKPLLTLWLGPEYSDLSLLLIVLVSHLCINLAVVPLFPIQEATNHVRVPGLLTLVMGVANASLAVTLALWSGWGYIGIAMAGAIVLTAKNSLFTPLYAARVLHLPWHTFLPCLIQGILGSVAVGAISCWVASTWYLTSWVQLGLIAVLISSGYLISTCFLALKADERNLLISMIRGRLQR